MRPTRIEYFTPAGEFLAVALELSSGSWKIGLHDGKREKPAIHTVSANSAACRLQQAVQQIEKVKSRWGLAPGVRTVVLYEAGQDGFWIARALAKLGYEPLICDPASIPVERHARRAKTDRLDVIRLLMCLRAWLRGEYDRMRVIRVPSIEAEAQRHLVRDRGELQKETMQHRDRIRKGPRTPLVAQQPTLLDGACRILGLLRATRMQDYAGNIRRIEVCDGDQPFTQR